MPDGIQRLFLFDIDGTLLKGSTAVHRDAFRQAFQRVYGLSLSLDGISAAGRTDTWLLAEPLRRHGLNDASIWERMPEAFRLMEEYVDEHLGDLRDNVLPGAPDVLAALHERGYLLGLLTGNLRSIALAKMRHAGLAGYFDTGGFGEESEFRARLVPVAIAKAGEQTGHPVTPADALVIGDTPFDIEAGRDHGTRTAGVATGPFSTDVLEGCGADVVLPSLADVDGTVDALTAVFAR